MKKFLKLMSFILVFSFLWIINTKSAQAGFSISVPKTITMYYGQMKKITPKLYYNGEFMKNDAHYGSTMVMKRADTLWMLIQFHGQDQIKIYP